MSEIRAYETGGKDIMKQQVYKGRGKAPENPEYYTGGFSIMKNLQEGKPSGSNGSGYDVMKKQVGK